MNTYLYNRRLTFEKGLLESAQSYLGVSIDDDGEEIRAAYLNKLPASCKSGNGHFSAQDIAEIDALNRSLEILVIHGNVVEGSSRLRRTIRINQESSTGRSYNSTLPHFSYDCWDPEVTPFSWFSDNYINEGRHTIPKARPPIGWHEAISKYFLPFHCLQKLALIYGNKLNPSKSEAKEYSPFHSIHTMDDFIEITLSRPFQRENLEDIATIGTGVPLKYKIMKGNKLYPFIIRVYSMGSKSLGALPLDLSFCLAALLEKKSNNSNYNNI